MASIIEFGIVAPSSEKARWWIKIRRELSGILQARWGAYKRWTKVFNRKTQIQMRFERRCSLTIATWTLTDQRLMPAARYQRPGHAVSPKKPAEFTHKYPRPSRELSGKNNFFPSRFILPLTGACHIFKQSLIVSKSVFTASRPPYTPLVQWREVRKRPSQVFKRCCSRNISTLSLNRVMNQRRIINPRRWPHCAGPR